MKKLFAILLCVIVCAMLLASCELVHSTLNIGKHTYEYIQYEKGHFRQYTCGCPSPEIMGEHYDFNEDGICDACDYDLPEHEHKYIIYKDHTGHTWYYTCGCTTLPNFSQHYDENGDGVCDYCEYLYPSASANLAKALLDYEQASRERCENKKAENPQYIYFSAYVERVDISLYLIDDADVAEFVEKYDLYNLFSSAAISLPSYSNAIYIRFNRIDFTEDVHQKIQQICDDEASIEQSSIYFSTTWAESYVPDIDYYTDDAVALDKFIPIRVSSDTGFNNSVIIRSRTEYIKYLDNLIAKEKSDYYREKLTAAKNKYDDAFFESYALIFTKIIERPSGSIRLTVNNLYLSEDKLYVVVRTDEPMGGTADMQYTMLGVVVDKNDVANVDEVITLE